MAGIFPEGGVNGASSAQNSLIGLVEGEDYVAGCPPLFFPNGCRPQFDPAAGNAIISEILNVLRDRGIAYDCSRLDNLSKAVGPHLIAHEQTVFLPVDPWPVKNGSDIIVRGNFTVQNTSKMDIECFCNAQLTTLVKTLSGGDSANLDVNLKLSNDNSYDGRLLYASIQMRRSGNTDYDSWQTSKSAILTIPAGGRQFFYELSSSASSGSAFQLKEDFKGCKWKFFGLSHTTADITNIAE